MTRKERPTLENIYDINRQVIARVAVVYDGNLKLGYSCHPEAVQAILLESELFLSSEVEHWTETVFVPLGLISPWIVTYAIEDGGLTHRAWFLGPPGSRLTCPLNLNDDRMYHKNTGWARNGKMVKDEVRDDEVKIHCNFNARL
jgi:hypothetical protein